MIIKMELRVLAHKVYEKTNKNVSVIGLKDKSAGHHRRLTTYLLIKMI